MATNKSPEREDILASLGESPVVLGRIYRDRITGITGLATSRTTFLHSCVRVAIQPQKPTKDNEIPEAYFLDEKQLEAVDGKDIIPYNEQKAVCVLGDSYKDDITGFAGVAVSITKFLYAAERTALQPTKLKDGKPLDAQAFDSAQLLHVKAKSKAPKPVKKGEPTGGPGDMARAHSVPSNRR